MVLMKRFIPSVRGTLKSRGKTSKNIKKTDKKVRSPFVMTKTAMKTAVVAGFIILGMGGYLWWQFIFTDPEYAFRAMLKNSLRTHSVTKVSDQIGDNQSLEQISRLLLGSEPAVVSQTTITQTAESEVMAEVVTEELGTPTQDFVRYVSISTSQVNDDGQELDFSELLGVWGVTEQQPGQATVQGAAFGEATLGIIPFGLVSSTDQKRLYEFVIENEVYSVDYLGVVKNPDSIRPQYTYPVSIRPEAYVGYLVQFAEAQGLNQLQGVNPADFRNVPAVEFSVTVDVISQRPVEITYAQNTRSERIQAFGVLQDITMPSNAIPAIELQQRLQSVQ